MAIFLYFNLDDGIMYADENNLQPIHIFKKKSRNTKLDSPGQKTKQCIN